MYYTEFETDLCKMILFGDKGGITRLHMIVEDDRRGLKIPDDYVRNDAFFEEAKKQLIEYAKGQRKSFDLKLNPKGTDFQKKCWAALCNIPYGETRTYKDIAIEVGNEKASRAVGMANNKNPIPVIIPCHRVIGVSGKLTGFAFGLGIKQEMINLEGGKL
jgi:methylated-DNA-[protein]-cysteine S-methyltransferase